MSEKIGVLGAGTWGIALARMLSITGHDVTVWSAIGSEIDSLSSTRVHPNLPGMTVPETIRFTKDISEACSDKEVIVCAVPSVFVRSTIAKAAPYLSSSQVIVDVAKGIEQDTFFTMSEIIQDELVKVQSERISPVVALSGPTHAEEVAKNIPTAIVAASKNHDAALLTQRVFSSDFMRVYTNDDIHGVELCGALKNIMALATGISDGLGYGDNTKAALMTRGMAEISRLGSAAGCDQTTFFGLAGIGDLIVTATSRHSRNNRCGYLMGTGVPASEAVKQVGMVVEGLNALPAAVALAKKYSVEVPIISTVDNVVNYGYDPREAVNMLMSRKQKDENK